MDNFINAFFNLTMPLSEHIDYTIIAAAFIVLVLSFVPKIDVFVEKITKFFMILAVISLIVLTLIVSYDVIVRKLFHGGSIALQELEWHLFDLTFLFAIAYTLSHDKHVRVDIFYDKFSTKTKAIIQIITVLFFVIPLSTLIVIEAIPFIQMSYSMHEQSGDPGGLCCRWIIKSAMMFGFFVVLLQSVSELKKAYYKLKHSKGN
ncbi:tripartite ATP-independent periplasmic transporter, DctQ component [Nautilia profundicola AmH]|uniref:Tripartite ATP-independent periplasmic transporter, DctQ component n=1 Tax=Nautilia profundicola (strain ATCC BAA-1463 / DSM 18972 / AmH) TaxID=598659 RepID=B9L9N6_NAUPA|nr:TRAP transporter small permease subunit [Nautilia profundicola]ACM92592.1 tripartite ATP-independent periplasmic transporter, DctQ component [Nautilia profundicola AmH]